MYRPDLPKNPRGFTVIELVIVVMVVALGMALAIPSFDNVLQKRQTTRQAEQVAAFIGLIQSEAIKRFTDISVELVYTSGTNWCLGAAEGSTGCNCTQTDATQADFCDIDGVPYVLASGEFEHSFMGAHSTDKEFAFDPVRGILASSDLGNAHRFDFHSNNGKNVLRVDVAATGRVQICSPV